MNARVLCAWAVHCYTALGLVCSAAIVALIVRGDDASFRGAFFLMMVATAIDATDGWLARRARVHDVLPQFDGSALDNLIDFHTYTSLPLFLIWRAGLLPGSLAWLLLFPLLASAYGFSQVNAKTDDGFFLGFPSYWNIVAFYLYVLHAALWFSIPVIVLLSILTFIPTHYIYATRGGPFSRVINWGAVLWFVMLALVLGTSESVGRLFAWISLAYPTTYMALSGVVTLRKRSADR